MKHKTINIPTIFFYNKGVTLLNNRADKIPLLLLRLILAYEFWEAGMMKYDGENWFSHITFPMPFNLLSNELL